MSAREGRIEQTGDPVGDPLKSFYKLRPRQRLREQALERMAAGETSASEVVRVTV
jgi:hypothetical protein